MSNYDNWDGLVAEAQKKAKQILKEDVNPVARRIVRKHIITDVYKTYSPAGSAEGGYDRRYELGNMKNIKSYISKDDVLLITSTAPPSPSIFEPKYKTPLTPEASKLMQWIEHGSVPNYFNNKKYPWMKPRPAIANSQNEINNSSEIKQAIQKGIESSFL